MTLLDPNLAGYSEAAATVFTWLADRVLGGAKKALDWGWERAQWAAAQDRYDEQIVKQHGWIRIFGQTTPKPLREVFTDVYVLDKPTAFTRFDPEKLRKHLWEQDRGVPIRSSERLPAEQVLSRGNKFFVLGKPGAGKTTFLKYLAVREAQRGKWGPCLGKIPIFISLKQLAESGKSLFDFIVEQFAVCHFPDDAKLFVERLLKEGAALVLFDGLDEVSKGTEASSYRRDQVTEQIEQFAHRYDRCHIVVTCRIAATEYTFDPIFIYLELADFAPDQVEAFVRNWFWDPAEPDRSSHLAEQMLAEWEQPEHEGIRDLGRNPLLLALLCLNYAETLSFPVRRVEIYQEALDALLKKWDASRQIRRNSIYRALSLGRKQHMFSRIAYAGFLQDEILFTQATLEAQIRAYLAHVPEMPDAIDIDSETVLAEIIEQHGIFAEQSHRLFSFAHLTFQEYYVAKYLSESSAPDALDPLMARVTDDKWREIFLLTASLLPDATLFLLTFEKTLHQLITPRPRLIAWLHWVEKQAMESRCNYTQAATRTFYAVASVLAGDLDLGLAFSLARNLDLTLAPALALDRYLALARDLDHARHLAHSGSCEVAVVLARSQRYCLDLGETTLGRALATLLVPQAGVPSKEWEAFVSRLDHILETCGKSVLDRYHRLRDETAALIKRKGKQFELNSDDIGTFLTYVKAIHLFYDCLQLAYTPDRRAFEDRILLPPPLTKQEA